MIPFAANALQCIVTGQQNPPETALSPWDFVTEPRPQAACTKKLVKIALVAPQYAGKQTKRKGKEEY